MAGSTALETRAPPEAVMCNPVRRAVVLLEGTKQEGDSMALLEDQKKAFGSFYKSARYNKILEPKTTLLIHLATAMSAACYP